MEKVGASGDDVLRVSDFVVFIIRTARRQVSDMTSRLSLSPSAVRLGKAASSAYRRARSLQKKS